MLLYFKYYIYIYKKMSLKYDNGNHNKTMDYFYHEKDKKISERIGECNALCIS